MFVSPKVPPLTAFSLPEVDAENPMPPNRHRPMVTANSPATPALLPSTARSSFKSNDVPPLPTCAVPVSLGTHTPTSAVTAGASATPRIRAADEPGGIAPGTDDADEAEEGNEADEGPAAELTFEETGTAACSIHQPATMSVTMTEAYPSSPPPPPPKPRRPPGAVDLGRGTWIRPQDMEWSFTTARGPGGQHVNKASTAAILRVRAVDIGGLDDAALERLRAIAISVLVGDGELLYRCDLHRSQLQNKDACEGRLRTMVSQAAVRPKVRKKTKPTWGSVQRRLEGKKKDGARKQGRRWREES